MRVLGGLPVHWGVRLHSTTTAEVGMGRAWKGAYSAAPRWKIVPKNSDRRASLSTLDTLLMNSRKLKESRAV